MASTKRINNLTSIEGILRQMRSIYRQTRKDNPGPLSIDDSVKLTNILRMITNVYRDSELEKRIEALENGIKR